MGRFARLAVPASVLACAIGVYEFTAARARRLGPPRYALALAWETASLPTWKKWKYIPLADHEQVGRAATAAIHNSVMLERLELTEAQRSKLVEVVTIVYTALPAKTPSEYLAAIAPLRRLRQMPDSAQLLIQYKELTNSPMPAGMGSHEALDFVWMRQTPRATETSLADPDGSWFGICSWDTSSSRLIWTNLYNIDGSYRATAEHWANPVGRGLFEITTAPEQSAKNSQSPLKMVALDTMVRAGERYVQLQLSAFWSPSRDGWVAENITVGSDEGLYWPV